LADLRRPGRAERRERWRKAGRSCPKKGIGHSRERSRPDGTSAGCMMRGRVQSRRKTKACGGGLAADDIGRTEARAEVGDDETVG
jgi:hypothetical protein